MNATTPHARVPVAIARDAGLSPQARCLFLILATYAGPGGSCWPSRRTLAADLGLSVRTVATLLNELERCGLLRRQSRRGTSTIFHLQFPEPAFHHPSGTATPCTGADEPRLTGAADYTGRENFSLSDDGTPPKSGSTLHRGWEAECTGSVENAQTCAADCTGSLPSSAQGCAADCTGVGSPLHGGVQPASHRTNSLNYTTELLPDTEAKPDAAAAVSDAPSPDPNLPAPDPGSPTSDLWSTRLQFDPTTRWPTYEQVRAYALRCGVPEPDALSIWESYTANGWVDRHGNPIRHWGAALSSAWRYREENRNRQSRSTNGSHYAFTHSTQGSHGQYRTQGRGAENPKPTAATHKWANDPRYLETVAILEARGYRFST